MAPPEKSHIFIRDVWKDRVVSFEGPNPLVAWLKGDASTTLSPPATGAKKGNSWSPPADPAGPVLFDGALGLTGSVSEPVALHEEMSKHAAVCLASFATGPRRVVLVCDEATDLDRPSARVGLRVLRF